MKFGEYLKHRRETKGWSQPIAAEKAGIEQSYLSKLETGKSYPSDEVFEKLVDAFQIEMDELVALIERDEGRNLKHVKVFRLAALEQSTQHRSSAIKWTVASLTSLVLGGGALGVALLPDTANARFHYRSEGILGLDEPLTAFQAAFDEDHELQAAMLDRLDQRTLTLEEYRGDDFIESAAEGRRYYRLLAESEKDGISKSRFFVIPAFMLIFGGLGGFLASFSDQRKLSRAREEN